MKPFHTNFESYDIKTSQKSSIVITSAKEYFGEMYFEAIHVNYKDYEFDVNLE